MSLLSFLGDITGDKINDCLTILRVMALLCQPPWGHGYHLSVTLCLPNLSLSSPTPLSFTYDLYLSLSFSVTRCLPFLPYHFSPDVTPSGSSSSSIP